MANQFYITDSLVADSIACDYASASITYVVDSYGVKTPVWQQSVPALMSTFTMERKETNREWLKRRVNEICECWKN